MDTVHLVRSDAVYDKIIADRSTIQEIAEAFTFEVPNAKHHPKVKAKIWDGKISLTSARRPYLYGGLRSELKAFCDARGYHFTDDASPKNLPEVTEELLLDFIETLNLPKQINGVDLEVRPHQIEAVLKALNERRITLISPTASGKSLIIYLILRALNVKTLIIVPRLGLLDQMFDDFAEYGYDVEANVHKVYAGMPKSSKKLVTVSTWQSLKEQDESYFEQYGAVIGDEVHGFSANELKGIMERMTHTMNRIGCTGSLDGSKTNELVIQGLFGPIHRVATTEELIKKGYLAELAITCLVLKHPDDKRKLLASKNFSDYQTEIDYLVECEARNRFIKNLALSLEGNTLILYRYVEKHGEPLYEMIKSEASVPVLFVAGKVASEDREEIRKFVNNQKRSIVIASVGTFSTGTNIPNLHNLITAAPTKSVVQILQSIGRILRKTSSKFSAHLYDIVDDVSWKSRSNHTLNHFRQRVKIYAKEKFKYKVYDFDVT